jgi:hypothetical protein
VVGEISCSFFTVKRIFLAFRRANFNEYFIFKKDDLYGIINNSGEVVIECKYDEIKRPHAPLFVRKKILFAFSNGKEGVLSLQKQSEILSCKYDKINYKSPGFVAFVNGEELCFDDEGNTL